jgi:hypothetical protein
VERVDRPPTDPVGSWRVLECVRVSDDTSVSLPGGGLRYYLAEDAEGRSLYEFDAHGRGLRYLDSFGEDDGLHFVIAGRARDSFEIIVPIESDQEGERLVYSAGTFETYKDGETTRLRGTPSYRCPFAL